MGSFVEGSRVVQPLRWESSAVLLPAGAMPAAPGAVAYTLASTSSAGWYGRTDANPAVCGNPARAQHLVIPYDVGGRTETIGVCVEGMPVVYSFGSASDTDRDIKKAIKMVAPATVQIKVMGNNRQEWAGSGFIMSPFDVRVRFPGLPLDGNTFYIHTNHHVANDAKSISIITADGKQQLFAQVVRSPSGAPLLDDVGDTALLMVRSPNALPTARIGSRTRVEQGDTVLTAGYPLALPKVSVTKGIISQPEQMTGQSLLAIQADAAINPGNSGGPLFTLDGTVVGTNTYTFRGANDLSFANAITEQLGLLGEIWQRGAIVRGDLGIDFLPLGYFERQAPGLPQGVAGARVSDVVKGQAAAAAGLKAGDIVSEIRILEYGRVARRIPIDFGNEYQYTSILNTIYGLRPGQEVELGVYRIEGNEQAFSYRADNVRLPVGRYEPRKEVTDQSWGITVARALDGEHVLTCTGPGTPAAAAGLGQGEWIISGIRAREIADFQPQPVRNLRDVSNMFRIMRQKGTTQAIFYVRSRTNPNQIRAVVLDRRIADLVASKAEDLERGAELLVA